MKPIELTIHSVINSLSEAGLPVGDPEINIQTVKGVLREDGDVIHLSYAEVQEGVRIDCHLMQYSDGRVSLSRRGGIVSDILFSEGESCCTVYSLPPYKFDMTVKTKKIRSSLCTNGGELRLTYAMNVGGEDRDVLMKISVKAK